MRLHIKKRPEKTTKSSPVELEEAVAAPQVSDTLANIKKALRVAAKVKRKAVRRCKVNICVACGEKGHDYMPRDFYVPCDHPWVSAPEGSQLLNGNGTKAYRSFNGIRLTNAQMKQIQIQENGKYQPCGCI